MLRTEALEIDDHVLDKIESRHGVPFHEVEEACYSRHRHVRRGREGACTRSSVRRKQDATYWWCWSTWAAASGRSSPRVR